jgi:hypothetical protein
MDSSSFNHSKPYEIHPHQEKPTPQANISHRLHALKVCMAEKVEKNLTGRCW